MGKKRNDKDKRKKYMAKAMSDGKISAEEGRRLANKGLSIRKVQNERINEHRRRQEAHNRRGQADRSPARQSPSYEPLKIKRGAERADFARQIRDYDDRRRPEPRRQPSRSSSSKPTEVSNPYKEQADKLMKEIEALKSAPPPVRQIIYDGSTSTGAYEGLQIAPATTPTTSTGTSSFKRRKKSKSKASSLMINTALNI